MRVPDRSAHSTAITISDSPAIMRLREGKVCFAPGVCGSSSDRRVPLCSKMCLARVLLLLGWMVFSSSPEPMTAMVVNPALSAAWCAMPSMPMASPDTMVMG